MTLKSVLLFVDPVFSPPARGQHLYREKIDQLKDTYSQIALILIKNSEILTQFAIQRNLTLFRKMKAIYDLSEASELLFNTNGSFKNNSLFCFDFSGSGLSDGEYISLGFYEREDLKVVIEYLRNSDKVTTVGLWGRSMGAVTALMHANRDHSIAGLVLDSPFTSLPKLSK